MLDPLAECLQRKLELPKLRAIPTLNFLYAGGRQTHGRLDFGRRVEQRWPYYFFVQEAADQTGTRGRPAPRAEVVLLFLAGRAGPRANLEKRRRGEEGEGEEVGLDLNLTTPTQRVGKYGGTQSKIRGFPRISGKNGLLF